MFTFFKKRLSQSLEEISTSELERLLYKEAITLLDVRTSKEYSSGHIRQARNIPLEHIASYQGSKDAKIYVICQSGMRSKHAVKRLTKMGYRAVNVRGGMATYQGKKIGG